ncbi:histidine phosphatase family protein [Pseudomonas sp. URMO17WK12:I12]|jgi:phosphohistidine phosphatase SixA|uniref:lipopolysaccharide core heptose(II)-phosphate phosphatase PmrG n=1 Tax=unclassified Pseudomonas TaxID=196821 RepID=UPI0004B39D99|nr:histidine phosphatase family protein [Pseudomonas sp. URMO17WK12:I12]
MTSRTVKLASLIATSVVAVVVTGLVLWPRSPTHLVSAESAAKAELFQDWQAGEVVALVRHAERCDQSSNPCLGPADGITRFGNESSTAVGQHFMRLGMAQTDVLSSPATRTIQTSHAMFGNDPKTQEWLVTCGKTLRNDVVAHKQAHRNLVLVSHSGCIGDFLAETGFPHAAKSEYGSTVFLRIDTNGQLQVLGIINPEDWNAVQGK